MVGVWGWVFVERLCFGSEVKRGWGGNDGYIIGRVLRGGEGRQLVIDDPTSLQCFAIRSDRPMHAYSPSSTPPRPRTLPRYVV